MQGAGRTGISPALGITLRKARRRHAGGRLSDSHPRGAQLCPHGRAVFPRRVPAFVICQPAFCFRVRVDPEVNGRPVQTGLGPSATLRPPPCSLVNSRPRLLRSPRLISGSVLPGQNSLTRRIRKAQVDGSTAGVTSYLPCLTSPPPGGFDGQTADSLTARFRSYRVPSGGRARPRTPRVGRASVRTHPRVSRLQLHREKLRHL